MKVLGIETTCDETAAAVVDQDRGLLSNVVFSQVPLHEKYGGVVPELAARAHLQKIGWVVDQACRQADLKKPDAVAFAAGPGLMGPLLVGRVAAQTLGMLWDSPVVGVNHLEGHVFAAEFEHELLFPLLALIVSGGHTDLVVVKKPGVYQVLGRTRDDAAGECFDKAAKILGLGYPGGPVVDRLAKEGDKKAVDLPRPFLKASWDFSFSGLKTALLYYLNRRLKRPLNAPFKNNERPLGPKETADVCASLQEAICKTLVEKTILAARRFKVRQVVVGGGVAANSRLRELFKARATEEKIPLAMSSPRFCTDNGAMIAQVGLRKMSLGLAGPADSAPRSDPSLGFKNWRAGGPFKISR